MAASCFPDVSKEPAKFRRDIVCGSQIFFCLSRNQLEILVCEPELHTRYILSLAELLYVSLSVLVLYLFLRGQKGIRRAKAFLICF